MVMTVPPAIRDQIERYMADRARCMPSERQRLEEAGFTAADQPDERERRSD
jgi:hypothetical protein